MSKDKRNNHIFHTQLIRDLYKYRRRYSCLCNTYCCKMFRLVLSLIVFSNVVSGNAAHIKEVHRSRRSVGLNDVDNKGNTQLHRAVSDGLLDTVIAILFQGPDLTIRNKEGQGNSPLDVAVIKEHLNVVKALLLAGAPPNSVNSLGHTALFHAVWRGADDIAIALIDKGANMTIKNNYGETPLNMAVVRGHLNVVKTLLARGSPVNSDNVHGNVALHHAAWNGRLDIVLELLSKGADKCHKNNAGQTPRDMAIARGHADVANVL